jgi:glycosyltransferase involved in cell wall biosynthesis
MPLKIVHINTADVIGGAGIAAYRLHQALNRVPGVESSLLVGIKASGDPGVVSVYRSRGEYLLSRLAHRAQVVVGLAGSFSPLQPISKHPLVRAADIVHLHHINGGFFSYRELIDLSRMVPQVWTLHDMWGFTGTCHSALGCRKWEIGCGCCPHPPVQSAVDLSHWHWKRKKEAYRSAGLTIVTPSHWLKELACSSPLMGHLSVRCIPNAVDTEVFKPINNVAELRRQRGISPDARVVMIASHALTDRQKGVPQLLASLRDLPHDFRAGMSLLLAGKGSPPDAESVFGKDRVVSAGYIDSPEKMAECYAMADVFLHPTLADNLPNSLVESIACGTPAITFDVGGCGDVVRHLDTGYLAREAAYDDFIAGVGLLLTDNKLLQRMKAACRVHAVDHFSSDKMTHGYVNLYRSILKQRS